MRRVAQVDGNHRAIVEALRSCGAIVVSLAAVGGGVPDLLVGWQGRTLLLEVKNAKQQPNKQRLRPSQVAWIGAWRGGEVRVVHTVDEALAAIGVRPSPNVIRERR